MIQVEGYKYFCIKPEGMVIAWSMMEVGTLGLNPGFFFYFYF